MARLLIADDDHAYCAAFRAGMSALGHSVDSAHDAAGAMTALNHVAGRYHVMFLDVLMSGGGGLLPAIRRQWMRLPVVVISGRAQILDDPLFRRGLETVPRRLPKTARLRDLDTLIAELA